MRLITNGKIKDVRLSTIYQICSNSNIDVLDILIEMILRIFLIRSRYLVTIHDTELKYR